MKRVKLKLELGTPAFLAGADQSKAEWRAASVRGQLRWWFRAVAERGQDLGEVRKLETEIFGSTERRSPLTVRARLLREPPEIDRAARPPYKGMWPAEKLAEEIGQAEDEATIQRLVVHNQSGKPVPTNSIAYLGFGCLNWRGQPDELWKDGPKRGVLYPRTQLSLTLQWRPKEMRREDLLEEALWAWLNLGGIGGKSRNGFGSLYLSEVSNHALGSRDDLQAPTLEKLRAEVKERFPDRAQRPPGDDELPEWTRLSRWSRVLISQEDHERWEDALGQAGAWLVAYRRRYGHPGDARTIDGVALANRDYTWAKNVKKAPQAPDRGGFGLPLPFSKNKVLSWDDGGSGDGRRASPLHLHIARFGGRFHSVWTHLPARFLRAPDLVFSYWDKEKRKKQAKPFPVTEEQKKIVDRFLDWLKAEKKLRELRS